MTNNTPKMEQQQDETKEDSSNETEEIDKYVGKHADNPNIRSFVYLLESSDHSRIYIGATVDLEKRLRRHNGDLVGGAKRTKRALKRGLIWSRVCSVSGFPTWRTALQFEYRFQRLYAKHRRTQRKRNASFTPVSTALHVLQELMGFDRATKASLPYLEWPVPAKIRFTEPYAFLITRQLEPFIEQDIEAEQNLKEECQLEQKTMDA